MNKYKYVFYPLSFLLLIILYNCYELIIEIFVNHNDPKGILSLGLIFLIIGAFIVSFVMLILRKLLRAVHSFAIEFVLFFVCVVYFSIDNENIIIDNIPNDAQGFTVIYHNSYKNHLKWRFSENYLKFDGLSPNISNIRMLSYQDSINYTSSPLGIYSPLTSFESTNGDKLEFKRYRIDTFIDNDYFFFDYYSTRVDLYHDSAKNKIPLVKETKLEFARINNF